MRQSGRGSVFGWARHGHWIEEACEFGFGEKFLFEGELTDGLAFAVCLIGECGGFVVADDGNEAGAHGEAAFDEGSAACLVGLEAFEQV